MRIRTPRAPALVFLLCAGCALGAPVLARAATPPPHRASKPAPARTMPPIHFPTKREHTEFVVEVNAKGQVVRVKSGKSCDDPTFNLQTYGNALQMWIRHPNGTAQVGLYRVTYDYDPKTRLVSRAVSFLKAGGNWGKEPGAATRMMNDLQRENDAYIKQQQAEERKQLELRERAHLPSLQSVIGTPKPKPAPTHR